jgi:TP53 regulating kinase-like protein
LFIIDFGLSYFSERIEDKAVDLRLFKEVLSSAHIDIFKDVYDNFITGYSSNTTNDIKKILQVVSKIEKRGRYT